MTLGGSYQEFRAVPLARRSVEKVWQFAPVTPTTHLVLPDGRMDIIIRHSAPRGSGGSDLEVLLAGPTDRAVEVEIGAGEGYVGLRLHPGRAGCFGFDAVSVARRTLEGREVLDLLPSIASVLQPRSSPRDLASRLQAWLVSHDEAKPERPSSLLVSVLDAMHQSGGRERIETLAADWGCSERTLHRMFLRWVGLSPKAFSSVIQFHRCLRLLKAGLSPAQAAFEAGYADQPHMVRRFRSMGGFSPARRPLLTLADLQIPLGGV